ncbi:MAG TPA: tetratricopeptide repeat protein [Herpetosiphonaceae bacterium]|nr:tetratricopeptide repeat protein [Herpetosiphonaceae bacterium]
MERINPGRQLLIQVIRRRDDQIDLTRAALAIAWEDCGSIDIEETIRTLDALIARTRRQLVAPAPLAEQARRIVDYLHQVEGFAGNTAAYDDPDNSYLPQVIERRVGLPITLSLVLLHVGWQLGLPLEPSALPGHFMVRCPDRQGLLFLDLFYGRVLNSVQCRAFLHDQLNYEGPDPEHLPSPLRRQVLARLLRNLKHSYYRREDWQRALAATERIVLLEPDSADDLRDRGLLRARLGALHLALLDLERYAALEPAAPDQELIRSRARALAAALAPRN